MASGDNKNIWTPSIADAASIKELIQRVARMERVLGVGGNTSLPAPTDTNDVWLKIVDSDGAPNPNEYTIDVYATPFTSSAIASGIAAFNVAEIGNNSSGGCGYTFDATTEETAEEGDIYGLEYIDTGRFVKALDLIWRNDQWTYLFDLPLIPKVKRCESEGG